MTVVDDLGFREVVLGPPPVFVPITHGPTWKVTEDGKWLLPEHTLGWGIIAWMLEYLVSSTGTGPWRPTNEQIRFILWLYAIDESGNWLFYDIVLQRVKGWGKDPVASALCAIELVGPCRFSHWEHPDHVYTDPDGVVRKRQLQEYVPGAVPVGREEYVAWVQILATSKSQTKNTVIFLQSVFSKKAKSKYQLEINKEIIYASGGRRIEAVASSPRSLEGARPTFIIRNETHHWLANNEGHFLGDVIKRNLAKNAGGFARAISITNAYNPSEESVAQKRRESWETMESQERTGVLYDSLEAPEDALLFPAYTYLDVDGNMVEVYDEYDQMVPPSEEVVREHLRRVLEVVRGDATWLSVERIATEILDPDNSASEMRRFYFNSIVTGDDAYVSDGDLMATRHPDLVALRDAGEKGDVLRAGWDIVGRDEPVVLFFDGSKSDDSTALVGCRISDGFVFLVGIWEKPAGEAGKGWLAPRDKIDSRVHEAFARFKVVAFWADPSHAKDDEGGTRYWDRLIDDWHVRYNEQLQYWAVQTGDRRSSIMWDMTDPAKQRIFSDGVVRFADEMDLQTVLWDGHPVLRTHLRNARRSWSGAGGLSIRKPARGGRRKIDAAVCAIGARMLARLVTIKGLEEAKKPNQAWW